VPQFIRDLGANAIIAGGMGQRAIDMFQSLGIGVATGATGTIAAVVADYLRGKRQASVPCAHAQSHSRHEDQVERRSGLS
jgi:predicted Fe-Mo cluster-binding NifX family protein